MVCNFFLLTSAFTHERGNVCYLALKYERHIYETISGSATPPRCC